VCRLVAYFGPPLPLSAVLADAPHGLIHQSFAPQEMTSGRAERDRANLDG
jgi:glutamine amidotransferase